jgi:cyanophycinase
VERDFLKIPLLQNLITDSHFAKRDRMGRSLGFLARIMKDGSSSSPREVAIDEKSALLVEANGEARVVEKRQGRLSYAPYTSSGNLRKRCAANVSQRERVQVAERRAR